MKKQDFRLEALKLLQGLNLAVAGQAGTMARAPFNIYGRPTTKKVGSRTVYKYYVRFWNEGTQSYDTAVSSGQSSKADAFAWAMSELGKSKKVDHTLTWRELCSGMFNKGSNFLEFYLPLKASFGDTHREHSSGHLERYILPVVGRMEIEAPRNSRRRRNPAPRRVRSRGVA